MNEDDFEKLSTSLRQAGQIRRGELAPGRVSEIRPADIKAIRRKLNRTQSDFARMVGISVATLRNWEQGRRRPDGPARALLKVAARDPRAVVEALKET